MKLDLILKFNETMTIKILYPDNHRDLRFPLRIAPRKDLSLTFSLCATLDEALLNRSTTFTIAISTRPRCLFRSGGPCIGLATTRFAA
jgi:hypothetical protein